MIQVMMWFQKTAAVGAYFFETPLLIANYLGAVILNRTVLYTILTIRHD